jgi:hypothetical protein
LIFNGFFGFWGPLVRNGTRHPTQIHRRLDLLQVPVAIVLGQALGTEGFNVFFSLLTLPTMVRSKKRHNLGHVG